MKGDWKALGYDSETYLVPTQAGPVKVERITLDHRVQAAKEAAAYCYSRLKSIDVNVTHEEKQLIEDIEQLKAIPQLQLVEMVEKKIKEIKKV